MLANVIWSDDTRWPPGIANDLVLQSRQIETGITR
jgi:hypothetical protein